MKIHSIDDVTGSVDCFSPPLEWSIVLSQHRASHLDEGSILPLNNTILLRSVWRREFMSNSRVIEEFFHTEVLEFSAVVASNVLDLQVVIVHDSQGEALEDCWSF